jgi:uncharacterized protein with PQ loop repeat
MHIIVYIYLVATFGSIITAFPQIRQLWKMKNSEEFNILTWCAWGVAQVTTLVYSITIHSLPFILVNIGWVSYYAVILSLIFKYRNGGSKVLISEKVSANT